MLILSTHHIGENGTATMTDYIILLLVVLFGIATNVTSGQNQAYSQDAPAIETRITPDRQSYEPGESIRIVCEIRNVSNSTVRLPPFQIVDVHFKIYRDDNEILPFAHPSMPFYGLDEHGFIELLPGQAHIFKRILEKGAYNLPSDAGVYRLCMNYENNKKSMRNIDLWVGKIDSCAVLKIQERR